MPHWVVVATGSPSASTVTRRVDDIAPGLMSTNPTVSRDVVRMSPGRMSRWMVVSWVAWTEVMTSSGATPSRSECERDATMTGHSGHTAKTGWATTPSGAVVSW